MRVKIIALVFLVLVVGCSDIESNTLPKKYKVGDVVCIPSINERVVVEKVGSWSNGDWYRVLFKSGKTFTFDYRNESLIKLCKLTTVNNKG